MNVGKVMMLTGLENDKDTHKDKDKKRKTRTKCLKDPKSFHSAQHYDKALFKNSDLEFCVIYFF